MLFDTGQDARTTLAAGILPAAFLYEITTRFHRVQVV